MFRYRALIEKEEENFTVVFPDFECCVTFGKTIEEAKEMAQDVLNETILAMNDLDLSIPVPSGGEGVYFEVDKRIAFALELKKIRKEKRLTQIELARRLNISQPSYQKLEDPLRTNPSLRTISKLEKAVGKKIFNFA